MERIFPLVETFFFSVWSFSLLVQTVIETSGSQLQAIFLTNLTDFLASGTHSHFLRQQSTAGSENSSFFNWNIFFSQSFIPTSRKKVFCLMETVLFYSEFLLLVKTIIETWGKSIFNGKIYSC